MDDEAGRHVGDLGNVIADEVGRAQFKFADKLVKVTDIIGRSIVVAENPDDLGKGDSPLSKVRYESFVQKFAYNISENRNIQIPSIT